MKCCAVLKALLLTFGVYNTGRSVKIDVIDGLLSEGVIECNSPTTFRCQVTASSPLVQWAVGNPIAQDAVCFGSGCANSTKFPGRYLYTYDQTAGISNLKIANATFDDDRMNYQCTDQSSSALYNAIAIKAPPKIDTTVVQATATPNSVTATLTTGCIYPLGDINLVWYSTLVNGTDLKIHPNVNKTLHCLPLPNCNHANTSVESSIEIYTTNGLERDFSVNISFGSVHFSKRVGTYTVIDKSGGGETSDGLSAGAIAGIIIAIVVVAILVVVVICILKKYYGREKETE